MEIRNKNKEKAVQIGQKYNNKKIFVHRSIVCIYIIKKY